jgi:hypothetical protein
MTFDKEGTPDLEILQMMDTQVFTMALHSMSKYCKNHFQNIDKTVMSDICSKGLLLFTSYG